MGIKLDPKETKRRIEDINLLNSKLNEALFEANAFSVEIKNLSDRMVSREAVNILSNIPIDEINRDKKGFRIKALKDYGFNTIADIASASIYSITAVRGISADSAYSIKRIADDIANAAMKGVKIRLSTDNKSFEATQLVVAIARYKRSQPLVRECQDLIDSQSKNIEYAIDDLSPASSKIKWFFTSKADKEHALNAFETLEDLLKGDYGTKAKTLLDELTQIRVLSSDDAWDDFSRTPIPFFNILEDINPGVLGNSDNIYGLPEELAQEVQDECFFPDGLLCELRRYQEWGVKYILHQERVLLGDEMGLGKTVQAIAAMVSLKNTGAQSFVVVCPASVITNWCREIRKMSRLSVIKVHGSDRASALRSWKKRGGVAVTTYETTSYFKLEDNFLFDMLVVDEAHYIKNPTTRRTINVKALSEHTYRLLFMTGTALENNVDEMIELIKILQPQIASKVNHLKSISSAPQFRNEIAPVYYRRKRDDVLTELPELIESEEWCTLSAEEEKIYEQAVMGKHYADARRVSWNIDDLHNSCKARRLMELVEEAEAENRKIIVFSFFLDTIRKITYLFGNKCLNPINGSVSPQRRQEIIDEFDSAPAGTILAAQIQSGGTGLNIQSASVVVICEPQFKPSVENQAISRAYRMGQTRNVLVYRLLCENTVDEGLTRVLKEKQQIFDAFADKSVAAEESREIDEKTFGNIIQQEIDRIKAKYAEAETDA